MKFAPRDDHRFVIGGGAAEGDDEPDVAEPKIGGFVVVLGTVTVAADGKSGTFALNDGKAAGSFDCGAAPAKP